MTEVPADQVTEADDPTIEVVEPVEVALETPLTEQEPDIEFIWRDPVVGTQAEIDVELTERADLEEQFITQLQEMMEVGNLTGQIAETMLDPTDDFTTTIIFKVDVFPQATIPGIPNGGLGQGITLDPELMDRGFLPEESEFSDEFPAPTEEYPDADFYVVIAHEFAHRYPELMLLDPNAETGDAEGVVLILENTVREELGVDLRETYNGVEPPYGTTTIYELEEQPDNLGTDAQNQINRLETWYPPVDESDADLYDILFDTAITDIIFAAEEEEELQLEIPIEDIQVTAPAEEEILP